MKTKTRKERMFKNYEIGLIICGLYIPVRFLIGLIFGV